MEEATQKDLASEASRDGRTSILVVDDNHGMRKCLSALLAMMGFQVTQAEDGGEALELISRKKFELVFTDFEMPGMDGFALASNIKRSSPGTSVIMMTGSDKRVVQEKMRDGCVDSVLFKPFELEDIDERVRGALIGRFVPQETGQESPKAQRGG